MYSIGESLLPGLLAVPPMRAAYQASSARLLNFPEVFIPIWT